MITVRFPSGFSIQYNNLDNADIRHNGIYLGRKSSPHTYSVWVPLACVIEHIHPCRTYNPISQGSDEVLSIVRQLTREVASLKRKLVKVAK